MQYGARDPALDPYFSVAPLRDHGRRAGPGIQCGMQCGGRDTVRDPDFSVGPTAGSWTPCGAGNNMRDAMRGPGPQAVFKAGPVFIRDPEFRAASSMRDPGPRAESGCHVGSIVS